MEEEEEPEVLSHSELMELTNKTLTALIQNDPLLCDLPHNVTLAEVSSQVALQQGSALTVEVTRGDGEKMSVIVEQQGADVSRLKKAIQYHVGMRVLRETGRRRAISWRHTWKKYALYFDGEKLVDDNVKLKNIGLSNHAKVTFVKRFREKNKLGH